MRPSNYGSGNEAGIGKDGRVIRGNGILGQELKMASLREQKRLGRVKGGEEAGRYESAGDHDPVLRSHCRIPDEHR